MRVRAVVSRDPRRRAHERHHRHLVRPHRRPQVRQVGDDLDAVPPVPPLHRRRRLEPVHPEQGVRHPLPDERPHPATKELQRLHVRAEVRLSGQTGVEMEALTAVSIACLTIYDMAKALDKAMTIGEIRLVEKAGGKSGDFRRSGP